jgi:hypothetical protein
MLGAANAGIWGPLSVSATRNLPPHRAGAGSGVYNATRQLGAVLGSAAIAALMSAQIAAQLGRAGSALSHMATQVPLALEAPFSAAMANSMLLPAAVALVGAVASFLLESPHASARAGEEAGGVWDRARRGAPRPGETLPQPAIDPTTPPSGKER